MNVPNSSSSPPPVPDKSTDADLPIDQSSAKTSSLDTIATRQGSSPRHSSSVNPTSGHIETAASEIGVSEQPFQPPRYPELDLGWWVNALYSMYSATVRAGLPDTPVNEIIRRASRWLKRYEETLDFSLSYAFDHRFARYSDQSSTAVLSDPIVQLACCPAPRGEIGRLEGPETEWVRDVANAVELLGSFNISLNEIYGQYSRFTAALIWVRILLRADSAVMAAHAYDRVMAHCMYTEAKKDSVVSEAKVASAPEPHSPPNVDDSGHFEQKAAAYANVLRVILRGVEFRPGDRVAYEGIEVRARDSLRDLLLCEFAKVMVLENNIYSSLLRGVWEKVQEEMLQQPVSSDTVLKLVSRLCGLYKSLTVLGEGALEGLRGVVDSSDAERDF